MKNIFLFLLTMASLSSFAQSSPVLKKISDTIISGLPLHKSLVPPEAVEQAKKRYGSMLYSIEKSEGPPGCRDSYLVGLIRDGKLSMEWMCEDPKIAFWNDRHVNYVVTK
jgi:hypothetical protein